MQVWPLQYDALRATRQVRGMIGDIGVGDGKTLIAALVPTVLECQRAVVLVPAAVRDQARKLILEYSQVFDVRRVHVVGYSELSGKEGDTVISRHNPQVLIADEAHYLRHIKSARTRRVLRFLGQNPHVRFVALSGTLTNRSILDYAHLVFFALRENNPLPRDYTVLEMWSRVIDAKTQPLAQDWNAIRPLCERFSEPVTEAGARAAFRQLMDATPGVVRSGDHRIDASLRIYSIKGKLPAPAQAALETIRSGMMPGEDMPYESAASQVLAARRASIGFYLYWEWDNDEPDLEWLHAKRAWNSAVRYETDNQSCEGYDTESQISAYVSGWPQHPLYKRWSEWQAVKSHPGPRTLAKWVDDSILKWAVRMAKEHTALVWYQHRAVADKLESLGMKVFRSGEDPCEWLANNQEPCGVSVKAHGTGLNLQYHRNNSIVLEPPASAQLWEQKIGRTHRNGQLADTVNEYVMQQTPELVQALQGAKRHDAVYVQQSTGSSRRLLYADYCKTEVLKWQ